MRTLGLGEVLQVMRTVQAFERAGLAGVHLEDQQMPKRCGHLEGKTLIGCVEMERKLAAAVEARQDPEFMLIAATDARSVEGFDWSVERGLRYVEAGADAIFPEALLTPEEFASVRRKGKGPLLANMTEFGKRPQSQWNRCRHGLQDGDLSDDGLPGNDEGGGGGTARDQGGGDRGRLFGAYADAQ